MTILAILIESFAYSHCYLRFFPTHFYSLIPPCTTIIVDILFADYIQAKKARESGGDSGAVSTRDTNGISGSSSGANGVTIRSGVVSVRHDVGGGGGGGGGVVRGAVGGSGMGSKVIVKQPQSPSPSLPSSNTIIGKGGMNNNSSSSGGGNGPGKTSGPGLATAPGLATGSGLAASGPGLASQQGLPDDDVLVMTDYHTNYDDGLFTPPRASTPPKIITSSKAGGINSPGGKGGGLGEDDVIKGVHERLVTETERAKSRQESYSPRPGSGLAPSSGQGLAPGQGEEKGQVVHPKTAGENPVFLSTQQPSASTLPTTVPG